MNRNKSINIHQWYLFLLVCSGILVSGFFQTVRAQFDFPLKKPTQPLQTVYGELFGNGMVYSLNYDVIFRNNLGIRIGGSAFGSLDYKDQNSNEEWQKSYTMVFMGNYYIGHGNSRLQLGLGYVIGDLGKGTGLNPPAATMTVAYRLLPLKDRKLTLKIGFTPFIAHSTFYPSIGIGFGWRLAP